MSFGRHRQKIETVEKPVTEQKTKPLAKSLETILKNKIVEANKSEQLQTVIKEEKKPEVVEIKKTEIEEPIESEKARKKRIYNATNYIGLVGNNIVCKDFRAIIKKKGLQINVVLNELLHEWNTKNYNL